MNKDTYLNMQLSHYNQSANDWTIENKNPVVGAYQKHNEFKDYDTYLFDGIDTSNLKALEYGSGPGDAHKNWIWFQATKPLISIAQDDNIIDG